ncbi:nodal modulator 2 isoform X2 [Belonocnema kinseyi]|nr:nodal modulator 2 isoform X2 [Belonocnema kinseyi]XP_033218947.1 nodal modulator 2 isoform X2 [Belonocnema kinseyi]XP_033218948.1 nodal modulator 2 isoform X2 [Belonocnema kinseyi]
MLRLLAILLIGTFNLSPIYTTEDILGCGGFVKSHADIDFTKIRVILFTKTGSVKDQTECAPNSGYYFLPLYDKGEYVLKVEPPKGWSFEPTEVALNVDGASDVCSQGKDINFVFKGFGITGKVLSKGSSSGPKGVNISLYKYNQKGTPISTTITAHDGTFYFTPIQPGNYVVVASHPQWIMEKSSVSVTVREGNTELSDDSFSVFGYDVSGRVTSDHEPVSGVSFLLFGNGLVQNCETSTVSEWTAENPLCHIKSDKKGRFRFPAISYGEYKIMPYYAGTRTKFDVQPSELRFKVSHDSLILPQDFKVTGFTVSGIVRESIDGKPLVGAKVFLSGKEVGFTDQNGRYKIDNIKSGQYILTAEAPNMKFEQKPVKVSPSSSDVPAIQPSSYQVCGRVTLSAKGTLNHRKVAFKNIGSDFQTKIEINPSSGEFCIFLAPAKYQVRVIVSEEETHKGLQFFPLQQAIIVSSKPLNNINFLQLKATLKGTVKCLPGTDCSQAYVTLKVLDGITVKSVQAKEGRYQFTEILPGQYEVLIDTDVFCWENPGHKIMITSEQAEIPLFRQTGFSVTFISSHDTDIEYFVPGETKKSSLQLKKGSSRHCVPKAGEYDFVPKSCHIFSKPSYKWDVKNLTPIIITSTKHKHGGVIVSTAALDGVKVRIENDVGEPVMLGPLKYVKVNDVYKYNFEFDANADNSYVIVPISEFMLFSPSSLRILGENECHDNIASFNGELGKVITGSIVPPLDGVTVQIFGKDKEVPVHTLVTQSDGKYKVGPLDGKVDYSVTATMEGYVVTGPDAKGIFSAQKLAEIYVNVLDEADEKALQGVLLSLSGGQSYRKNSITNENGQMTFKSLSPGEYYLRPMMKEYKFNPSSKVINVQEGLTVEVKLTGNRVAFSAYGAVTSLNGEPEAGLLVEALGQSECSSYLEEATTEENGNFRIRGLQPSCIYAIRLKHGVEANLNIQRVLPSSIAVQATEDVYNLRLIAFHPISRTDISVHVISSQPDHYRTLKVKLCREDMPDSPIHIAKIDSYHTFKIGNSYNAGFLVHFPPLHSDSKKYFVQLDTSLSQSSHKYKSIPVYFEANSSFKHVKLNFDAERKHDQADINQTSVVALPFIMLVAFAFLSRDKLWSWLNNVTERLSKHVPVSRPPVQAIPIDPRADDIIVEQIMNINKRKTKVRKA